MCTECNAWPGQQLLQSNDRCTGQVNVPQHVIGNRFDHGVHIPYVRQAICCRLNCGPSATFLVLNVKAFAAPLQVFQKVGGALKCRRVVPLGLECAFQCRMQPTPEARVADLLMTRLGKLVESPAQESDTCHECRSLQPRCGADLCRSDLHFELAGLVKVTVTQALVAWMCLSRVESSPDPALLADGCT